MRPASKRAPIIKERPLPKKKTAKSRNAATKKIDGPLVSINPDEWNAMGDVFEDYFPLFTTFWKIGRPTLTDRIPTAAVSFDQSNGGHFIDFMFNPKFWNKLSNYERAFITAHESLHVFLNHGVRSVNLPRGEMQIANVAMDVVVNHMLVDYFGFDRSRIKMEKDLCWLDTVFNKIKTKTQVLSNQNFEYYFSLLMDHAKIVYVSGMDSIDDHGYFHGQDSSGVGNKIKEAAQKNPSIQDDVDALAPHAPAGTGSGGWNAMKKEYVAPKKSWNAIFKKMFKEWSEKNLEQWARQPRRFSNLPEDIILPSEMEDDEQKREKIKIWLFLDTSGSCIHMKDRFVKAYRTIPKRHFEVRPHSFDTQVKLVDMKKERIYGGGGTSFYAIEAYIQSEIRQHNLKYPQVVVVFTDGAGDEVAPQHAERWHWFLDDRHASKYLIPKTSRVFYLADME